MNKNTDAVPAGVAALYADIIAHPAEEWKASGSELPYLEWVEGMKAGPKTPEWVEGMKAGPKTPEKIYSVQVFISEWYGAEAVPVTGPTTVKKFLTKYSAQKFIKELEDFA